MKQKKQTMTSELQSIKESFFKKKLLFAFLVLFALSACEKKTENERKIDLSNIKIDLKDSKLGGELVLFKYDNTSELFNQLTKSISVLNNDSKEILDKNSEVTNVVTNISFINGKATISKILYINEDQKKIIEGYEYESTTKTYNRLPTDEESLNINWNDAIFGSYSPSGYSEVASCGNGNNPKECVTKAVSSYLSTNISGVGDCANVQVNVGIMSTRVCGKK